MKENSKFIEYPELVFGIAGPIGIHIDEITQTLEESLKTVGYESRHIKITKEIEKDKTDVPAPTSQDFHAQIFYKMKHANKICEDYKDPAALMRIAIMAIREHRYEFNKDNTEISPENREKIMIPKTAFIIRQLKRPEEVHILRQVYGKQFILVSAYGSLEQRKRIIETKLRRSLPLNVESKEIAEKTEDLIQRDGNEDNDIYGQNLRETFHLADVFIDGISKPEMTSKTIRFIEAIFGRADVAPSKNEYGMYAAKSASLRSSDLSRQVGAAIFSADGELITQGCNEVPKSFGGTYWDTETPDFRDVKLGNDPNELLKKEVIRDLLERLLNGGLLSDDTKSIGSASKIVSVLTKKAKTEKSHPGEGVLANSQIMELTEYGRVVHAEMCAICDAARLGRSIKGGILYCTTFPCHNCTKHILAAGIRKVIYMEPYPKSKAKELYENEIEIESNSQDKVSFIPFLGISPYRYRDIFQKGKRKRDGAALIWIQEKPKPMIEISAPTYIHLENIEIFKFLHRVSRNTDATIRDETAAKPTSVKPKKLARTPPSRPVPK